MAYGKAFRQRVLQCYDNGDTTAVIAKRFNVSTSWCRRVKQFRDQPPRKITGRPFKLDHAARDQLAARVQRQPDATLEELRRWCASELGISISAGALWGTLRRMKLTFKKVADCRRAVAA
jgi:transposase